MALIPLRGKYEKRMLKFFIIFLCYVHECIACMNVLVHSKCTSFVQCPGRSEEDIGSPITRIMDGWVLATIWMQKPELRYSARRVSALDHLAIIMTDPLCL